MYDSFLKAYDSNDHCKLCKSEAAKNQDAKSIEACIKCVQEIKPKNSLDSDYFDSWIYACHLQCEEAGERIKKRDGSYYTTKFLFEKCKTEYVQECPTSNY